MSVMYCDPLSSHGGIFNTVILSVMKYVLDLTSVLVLRNLHNYTLVFKETITIGFKDFYLFLLSGWMD